MNHVTRLSFFNEKVFGNELRNFVLQVPQMIGALNPKAKNVKNNPEISGDFSPTVQPTQTLKSQFLIEKF